MSSPALNRTPPAISGVAAVGQTLTVVHGTWTDPPTADVDQWLRCTTGGCSIVTGATGGTYVVTSADAGSALAVAEVATDFAGISAVAYSSPTAVVAQPSGTTGSTGTTGTTGMTGTTGTTGGSGAGSGVSRATLTKLLKALLRPTGKPARLRQLLKAGGYRYRFAWSLTGAIGITWSTPRAHGTTTLLARGTLRITRPGKLALTVKLQKAGRRALAHVKHLNVTIAGLFIGGGTNDATATVRVRLRR
jgi:hypothetical protein